MIKGIGIKLAITLIILAFNQGTPSNEAAIKPPRNSKIGKSEIIKIMISGLKTWALCQL